MDDFEIQYNNKKPNSIEKSNNELLEVVRKATKKYLDQNVKLIEGGDKDDEDILFHNICNHLFTSEKEDK